MYPPLHYFVKAYCDSMESLTQHKQEGRERERERERERVRVRERERERERVSE